MDFYKNKKTMLGLTIGLMALTNPAGAEDFKDILADHWKTATKEQVFFRRDPDGWRPDGKLAEVSKRPVIAEMPIMKQY